MCRRANYKDEKIHQQKESHPQRAARLNPDLLAAASDTSIQPPADRYCRILSTRLTLARRLFDLHARQRAIRFGNRSKILVDPAIELFRIEVADDDECRIVRPVKSRVKLLHVLERRGIEIFDTADPRTLVRVFDERFLLAAGKRSGRTAEPARSVETLP